MDALTKMWISFGSMGFMFLAIIIIYFSRYKISNRVFKFITAFAAYVFMILAGLIMLWVVLSGPTMEA
ncbi:hypothetical protein JMA_19970 [Jeotgalibacillus malaysiensis]|uniref:NAD(FAD)-dependent dehydrogenase n=1 Tax=Jeotgalibacillus malaysiensis TaxID=1508404 RepID=A0A0B5ATJ3_9BACL|nr:DUF2768 domain-containing protein [Jeotgalibacillus malaysiensis]AJD91314.1 hypothetical protein JMA_19970 [Jeotgalibacillus malaysiensis]